MTAYDPIYANNVRDFTSQLFLLQKILPENRLLKILKSRDITDKLGLQRFYINQNINSNSFFTFPFMLNRSTPLGEQYAKIREFLTRNAPADLDKYLQELVTANANNVYVRKLISSSHL